MTCKQVIGSSGYIIWMHVEGVGYRAKMNEGGSDHAWWVFTSHCLTEP